MIASCTANCTLLKATDVARNRWARNCSGSGDRSIFNGRKFSQHCIPPPPVHLLDIARILREIKKLSLRGSTRRVWRLEAFFPPDTLWRTLSPVFWCLPIARGSNTSFQESIVLFVSRFFSQASTPTPSFPDGPTPSFPDGGTRVHS